jgi:hypothetical protein
LTEQTLALTSGFFHWLKRNKRLYVGRHLPISIKEIQFWIRRGGFTEQVRSFVPYDRLCIAITYSRFGNIG